MCLSLVIVHDLNIDPTGRTFRPFETDPPLIVDTNAVLTLPVPDQRLETVARQRAKVLQRHGRLEAVELQLRGPFDSRERLDPLAGGELPGPFQRPTETGEVLDLLENEAGMHSCTWRPNPRSPVSAGGKRRHPRGLEDTGIGADKP